MPVPFPVDRRRSRLVTTKLIRPLFTPLHLSSNGRYFSHGISQPILRASASSKASAPGNAPALDPYSLLPLPSLAFPQILRTCRRALRVPLRPGVVLLERQNSVIGLCTLFSGMVFLILRYFPAPSYVIKSYFWLCAPVICADSPREPITSWCPCPDPKLTARFS